MREGGKTPWLQRPLFRQLVDEWMAGNNKSKKDFAQEVGIAPDSLKQYYSGKHLPGRDLLLRFAAVLGCPAGVLIGDAPTDTQEDPEAHSFGNIMGVLGKNLTPEMRAVMIEMARAAQGRGREREAAQAASVAEATTPYTAKGKKPPKV